MSNAAAISLLLAFGLVGCATAVDSPQEPIRFVYYAAGDDDLSNRFHDAVRAGTPTMLNVSHEDYVKGEHLILRTTSKVEPVFDDQHGNFTYVLLASKAGVPTGKLYRSQCVEARIEECVAKRLRQVEREWREQF